MADEPHSQVAVLATVSFYMFSAISMTLLNKTVLTSAPLPVFLLFCQSGIAVACLTIENLVGPFKTPKFDRHAARQLLPLVGINVIGLVFNNYCLTYVDASFHQVARGLVLPFTIVVSIIALKQWPAALSLFAAMVVTSGFFAGVLLDPNHSSSSNASSRTSGLGIVFGVLSSALSACHSVVIKKSLAIVDGSPISLAYYSNILSTAALLPVLSLSGEMGPAVELVFGGAAKTFLWGTAATGVFGFLIGLASVISIKVTSPVTHMISSAARGVLQTMLAVWLFGDVMSIGRMAGIFLIISGSVLYVYSQSIPRKAQPVFASIPMEAREAEQGLLNGKQVSDRRNSAP